MNMSWLPGPRKWGAASAALLAGLLFTVSGSVLAQSGIATTRHNLGSTNNITDANKTSTTAEICVFCHTPHGANTDAPAPLWNKRLGVNGNSASGATYTTYANLNSPSIDGTIAPVGSVSMACLSCHDGTQAMDNIINAPGSGNVLADGGGTNGRGWSWSGDSQTAGKLTNGANTGRIANLGTDLSNDHPIGIQYCGGGYESGGTGACKDADFVAPTSATINNATVFWVDTGNAGTRQRTDLPLYPRGALGPMVECASCHDPHVSSGQAGPAGTNRSSGETFLRISNDGSAVCRACHVK